MKGINSVTISGNALGNIEYGRVTNGAECCGFSVASERHSANGVVTAFVKVNVYVEGLVRICRAKLAKGVYVVVQGELMNRDGQHGDLTEVRAREIIFLPRGEDAGGGARP
jgi:single-stranded DNA-binding protein